MALAKHGDTDHLGEHQTLGRIRGAAPGFPLHVRGYH